MELKYCLYCGKEVAVEDGFHIEATVSNGEIDIYGCDGPFADSPPPSILSDEQWETVFANEPSNDELEMMNREAEILIQN